MAIIAYFLEDLFNETIVKTVYRWETKTLELSVQFLAVRIQAFVFIFQALLIIYVSYVYFRVDASQSANSVFAEIQKIFKAADFNNSQSQAKL